MIASPVSGSPRRRPRQAEQSREPEHLLNFTALDCCGSRPKPDAFTEDQTEEHRMRISMLCLTGALAIAAIPLSANAQPPQTQPQTGASAAQATPEPGECRRQGWVWEPAGDLTHGQWRPAHCSRRDPTD
jgi:hypothetical protein